MRRHLVEMLAARPHPVGDVVCHQRGIIGEAVLDQEIDRRLRRVIDRRAIAARRETRHPPVDGERLLEGAALRLRRDLGRVLMEIAVMADLVASRQDRLDGLWIALHRPARDEEGLLQAEPAIGLKDARHADGRPVAPHGDRIKPVPAVLRPGDMDQAVGIDVEGDGAGAARAVRPRDRILDQGFVPRFYAASARRPAMSSSTSPGTAACASAIERLCRASPNS